MIDAGADHNVVLRSDNSVYTWGENSSGQLGIGSTTSSNVAVYSSGLSTGTIIDVAAGLSFTFSLRSDGNTRTCGSNQYRSLGVSAQCSNTGNFITPIAGPYFSGGKALQIPSTSAYGHVVTQSGQIWGWGNNLYGQVGSGSSSNYVCPPQQVNYSGSPNYCSAKPSPDNHPQPCCVAVREDERMVIGTNGGTVTLTGSISPYTNLNMAIFGTVILEGNRTFSNCNVVMGKDAKIIVNSGRVLNIHTNSHFYACGDMWDGIVVNNNGRILVQTGSIIEDAEVAVDIQYGAQYTLNNSTFNRNYIHVNKAMPPSGTPQLILDYPILKCKFLCHATPVVGGVHATLLSPRQSQRSYMGVQAIGVPKILVGSTLANANTFENIDFGIYAEAVPRTSILYNNFRDHTVGARVEQGYATTTNNTIDFKNNNVLRSRFGIICFDNDTTARIRITNNEIDYTGMASPTTFMTGITVSEVTPAPGGGKYNWADISDNTILRAPCGISLQNLYGDHVGYKGRLFVGNNTITHTKPDDNVQAGILLGNVTQPVLLENIISSPAGYLHWAETGIRMSGGADVALYCNETHNVGRGIWVDGTIGGVNDLVLNEMDNSQTGLLLNWGIIGQQGNGTLPHDNMWTNWNSSNANTLVFGSNGALSRFYVRNVNPSIYYPQNNWNAGGSPVPISTSTGTWGSGCYYTGPAFKTEEGEPQGLQSVLSVLAQDEPETDRERTQQWMAEYALYRKLLHDNGLINVHEDLNTFFVASDNGNIGRLHRSIDGFAEARHAQEVSAPADLQGIVPQNLAEERLRELLTILYANASDLHATGFEQVAQLREIARMCPLDEGLAVHIARAALLSIDTLPQGYMNPCEMVAPQDDEKWKQEKAPDSFRFKVYPNPSNGEMMLEYVMQDGEHGMIEVFDLIGNRLFSKPLTSETNNRSIELKSVPNGLYLLTVSINGLRVGSEKVSIIK